MLPTVHNRTLPCAGASPLLVNATSSASVLLWTTKKCKAAPFEVLLRQVASTEWTTLSEWATRLPLEVGSVRCQFGCHLRLRALDAASFATRLRSINHNATAYEKALNVSIISDESQRVVTPFPEVPAYHPPAVRLELMLKPPLPEPVKPSCVAWTLALVQALYGPHFMIRPYRMKCPEVSTTGSFVLLDLLPEDVFTYVSGPPVPEVLVELGHRAPLLNVSGHRLDVRFGLWRQAIEGTKIHGPRAQYKLWPRQHEAGEAVPSTTAVAAAQAAATRAPLSASGDDDDDDSAGNADDKTYDTLSDAELMTVRRDLRHAARSARRAARVAHAHPAVFDTLTPPTALSLGGPHPYGCLEPSHPHPFPPFFALSRPFPSFRALGLW